VRGVQTVDLTWHGAISANIDIYRNSNRIATVPNTGSYTDSIGVKGGNDRYTYKVCESPTQNCSNEVTVRFGGPPVGSVRALALAKDRKLANVSGRQINRRGDKR